MDIFHYCVPSPRLLSRSWVKVKRHSQLCEGQPLCDATTLQTVVLFSKCHVTLCIEERFSAVHLLAANDFSLARRDKRHALEWRSMTACNSNSAIFTHMILCYWNSRANIAGLLNLVYSLSSTACTTRLHCYHYGPVACCFVRYGWLVAHTSQCRPCSHLNTSSHQKTAGKTPKRCLTNACCTFHNKRITAH